MKITRLKVTNFRGIEALDTEIAPNGAIVSGGNGKGKTSVLRALQAALAARGVDSHAIRIGAEKAEVLVDLENVSVKRVITPKGSRVEVTNADGFAAKKPQTFLDDLLGTAALDPIDLFLAPAKERRRMILAALPVTVTVEQLRQWAPTVPETFDCSGHGLEVVERLRKIAYDQRTQANAKAKAARDDADRAAKDAEAAAVPEGAPSLAAARAEEERTRAHLATLQGRRLDAAAAIARTEGARAKIAKLRADADAIAVPAIDAAAMDQDAAAWVEARDRVVRLRAELAEAERVERACAARVHENDEVRDRAQAAAKRAADLRAQADTLEETLGAATIVGPSDDEIAGAEAAVARATSAIADAEAAVHAAKVAQRARELAEVADQAEREAVRLDAIVKALANDAPAALLAQANGIPGLSLDGDEILLDGKSLDGLCGAEQLKFAIEIAKRLNAKTRFLLVDGVERLDPEQMERFVELATADGWQLLCTRVASGGVVIEAIEPTRHAEAAE